MTPRVMAVTLESASHKGNEVTTSSRASGGALHLKLIPTFVWQSQSAYVDAIQDDAETAKSGRRPDASCPNAKM